MSQRPSGYERRDNDLYETPAWVVQALVADLRKHMLWHFRGRVWEPACGSGQMVRALEADGIDVIGTDAHMGEWPMDFLEVPVAPAGVTAIVTNPPFGLAQEFIEMSLVHAADSERPFLIAMLLRADYDHAVTRQHLFGKCRRYMRKVALTRRIVWFTDPETGKPKASPSYNHAWFIWRSDFGGLSSIGYAP